MSDLPHSALDQFLAEGLFKYAEAHATVMAFEAAIREKVEEIAVREGPRLPGTKSKPKVSASGVCNATGQVGRVAYVNFRGELGGENVTWELGIWWKRPAEGKDVLLYIECVDGPEKFTAERWAKPPKSSPFVWEAYVAGLSVKFEPSGDLVKGFRALLDEVARQSLALSPKKG